jgi:hypothetical protein
MSNARVTKNTTQIAVRMPNDLLDRVAVEASARVPPATVSGVVIELVAAGLSKTTEATP